MPDVLGDPSKEVIFLRKNSRLFRKLVKQTHFNSEEIEALALIYLKVVNERGPITRSLFRDILHAGFDFTENIRHLLIDRIFSVLTDQNALHLDLERWIKALSLTLRGTLSERSKAAFQVYDSLMSGKVRREQIYLNMRGCLVGLGDEDQSESLKDLVEMILKNLDLDRDGHISEVDFCQAADKNPLLVQSMGPVFPSREACYAFLTTFTRSPGDF